MEWMEATRRKRSELFQFVERHRVGQNHGDLDDGAIMATRSRRESVDLGPDAWSRQGPAKRKEKKSELRNCWRETKTEHKEKPCVCVVYTGRP